MKEILNFGYKSRLDYYFETLVPQLNTHFFQRVKSYAERRMLLHPRENLSSPYCIQT